jgi:hypothetical protein
VGNGSSLLRGNLRGEDQATAGLGLAQEDGESHQLSGGGGCYATVRREGCGIGGQLCDEQTAGALQVRGWYKELVSPCIARVMLMCRCSLACSHTAA